MANKITLTANDGSIVEFYDEIKAQGGVKDVYSILFTALQDFCICQALSLIHI